MTSAPSLRPSAAVSGACLGLGAVSFIAGWILLAIAAPDVESFFYQPRVLAVTHTFTLGWISLTMIGVLYQYVPSLTKQPLPWPRAAGYQVALFVVGAAGMISHFWLGHLSGMAWSAGLVWVSVILFAVLLLPPLVRAPRIDATVIGITAAICYFAATATLGLLYAIDKVHPFLGGSVLANIAGHAHLGLVGWISLTICAVSYRLVAAFLLPLTLFPDAARRQIVVLAALVPVLLIALLARAGVLITTMLALLIAVAMGWYAIILGRLAASRRMPLDWSLAHVIAALIHLGGAIVCAVVLLVAVDPAGAVGSRVVVVYGVLLLVGWVSNFIVGMATRMASGLMGAGARPLLTGTGRATVFGLLNGGIIAVAVSMLTGYTTALRVAALLPMSAGLVFGTALVRRVRSRR